jgi:cytoskeletal protein CcmA (bactofilin family)
MTGAETRAVLGDQTEFSGKMTGRDLTILGRFEGEVALTGALRIGRDSVVKAQIQAADVEVEGAFEGEIRAGRLAFGETARAKGVFMAERLSMREGARVDGAVNLPPVEVVLAPAAEVTAVVEAPAAAAADPRPDADPPLAVAS